MVIKRFCHCLALIIIALLLSNAITIAGESKNVKLAKALSAAYVEVAERVKPVVVTIETTALVAKEQRAIQNENITLEDIFDIEMVQFLNRWQEEMQDDYEVGGSIGSGVIVSEDGVVVTNYHVIENALDIKVKLDNGEKYNAEIIGVDPKTDLAVIHIKSKNRFPYAELGDSAECKAGSIVIAIGAPEAFEQSVTCGHISAVQRSDYFDDLEDIIYKNYIQTDAPINHGNSGGPLVNLDGEVIGINTLGLDDADNINFAIPVNMVKNIVGELLEYGEVRRGYLGLTTYNLAKLSTSKIKQGLLVEKVYPDTPAALSDIRMGDILLAYDGVKLKSPQQLLNLVAGTEIDSEVKIKLIRNNRSENIRVNIAEQPEALGMPINRLLQERINNAEEPEYYESQMLGITVVALPLTQGFEEDIAFFKDEEGLLIIDIADKLSVVCADLLPGMIVKFVNFEPVKSIKGIKKIERKIKSASEVVIQATINEEPYTTVLDLNMDEEE